MSRLSDLDAALVPRLALALRALLDGVSRGRARAAHAVLLAFGRRPKGRSTRSGPRIEPLPPGATGVRPPPVQGR